MNQKEMITQQIDTDAKRIVSRLLSHGHEAYLVGGCVRDLLLGYPPKDFDIATSATPAEIRLLFRNSRIIGRRFRLVHLFYGEKTFQVATFRAPPQSSVQSEDEDTQDFLIRSDNIFGTAKEDAERRDFTMNGLFYRLNDGQVIDYVGGMQDLETRQIRMIGDPDIRFQEDPVRMLRAIRFSARLGFDIEDTTYSALITHRNDLTKSAPARLVEEFYKLLRCGAALESFVLLRETKVLDVLLPRLAHILKDNPLFLDRYLQKLDLWISQNTLVENASLLFILGLPDFDLLGQPENFDSLERFNQQLIQGIDSLIAQLLIPRKDVELLQRAAHKIFWPHRHKHSRKDEGRIESIVTQISDLYFSIRPPSSTVPANQKKPATTQARKRSYNRRKNHNKPMNSLSTPHLSPT